VNGFIANHCSAQPHSSRNISTTYTSVGLDCLPSVLRRHGWHTAFFTGSDPDWDNQSIWLSRWYDEATYYPEAEERDRDVFARALKRIRELGNQSQPFFATVVSISNHYPFRSREPQLDLNPGKRPADAVLNTIHYTDDVVRQFVDSISKEPWYPHTLIVVDGDHGYNLGEHDGTPGQRNGWRESVWVPFLIHGAHPRLRPGTHPELASQLDLAPTVTDLLGIRDTTSWMGRSLLNRPAAAGGVSLVTGDVFFSETARWSLVVDLSQGIPHLYDADHDPLQQSDMASQFPAEVLQLQGEARHQQSLWDILVEFDRVWPQAGARTR
jgi:phosphoglycerol transferase MdoB-like AlkP superfamily enzyme